MLSKKHQTICTNPKVAVTKACDELLILRIESRLPIIHEDEIIAGSVVFEESFDGCNNPNYISLAGMRPKKGLCTRNIL